jgi:hypothetical protein
MANDPRLPSVREKFLNGDYPSGAWRKFLEQLSQLTGTSAEFQDAIAAILVRLDALESDGGDLATLVPGTGISIIGQLHDDIVRIALNANLGDLLNVDEETVAPAEGDRLTWDATLGMWIPAPDSPSVAVLPLVTGEIDGGQPVFVYADDGSLIYTEIE